MHRLAIIFVLFLSLLAGAQTNVPYHDPIVKPTAFEPYLQPPAPALAGLWINTNPGIVWLGGIPTTIPSARISLQASATNYVFVNLNTNTIQVNQTGFGATIFPIAIISTNNVMTTTVQDVRPDVFGGGGGGGGGGSGPSVLVNGNSTSDQTVLNLTDGSGFHFANPSGGVVTGAVTGNISVTSVTTSLPTDIGNANVYAACPGPPNPTLAAGLQVPFIPAHSNTGASTFSLCGGTSIAIQKNGGSALVANDILINAPTTLIWNGTAWQDAAPMSGGVTSYTGGSGTARNGAVSYLATDPGVLGITQVGTGTLSITKSANGTLVLGDVPGATNYIQISPDTSPDTQVLIVDKNADFINMGTTVGFSPTIANSPGILFNASASSIGTTFYLNRTDIFGFISGVTGLAFDFNATGANFNIPVNFSAAIPFLVNGSAGTAGQCLGTDGVTPQWISCASSSVGAVNGTPSQITATGTSTITLSLPTALTFPGNLFGTPLTNGGTLFTMTRNTDSSPAGNFLLLQSAALATLGGIDVSANFTGKSYTANGAGGGFTFLTQGADNSGNCPVNSVCRQAPTSVTSAYTVTAPGAGPSVTSVPVHSALSGTVSTESEVPTTATSATFIQTAVASAQSAPNNTLPVLDGSGNIKSSGTLITGISPTCNSATVGVVPVCGSVNVTSKSSSLANTNIISGTVAAGQYQLSVYMNGTTACATPGPGSFAAKIAYTDSNGAVTRTAGTLTFDSALPTQQPAVITFWLQSSTSTINVSGTYTACTTGTFVLDAHYTLTRIQ